MFGERVFSPRQHQIVASDLIIEGNVIEKDTKIDIPKYPTSEREVYFSPDVDTNRSYFKSAVRQRPQSARAVSSKPLKPATQSIMDSFDLNLDAVSFKASSPRKQVAKHKRPSSARPARKSSQPEGRSHAGFRKQHKSGFATSTAHQIGFVRSLGVNRNTSRPLSARTGQPIRVVNTVAWGGGGMVAVDPATRIQPQQPKPKQPAARPASASTVRQPWIGSSAMQKAIKGLDPNAELGSIDGRRVISEDAFQPTFATKADSYKGQFAPETVHKPNVQPVQMHKKVKKKKPRRVQSARTRPSSGRPSSKTNSMKKKKKKTTMKRRPGTAIPKPSWNEIPEEADESGPAAAPMRKYRRPQSARPAVVKGRSESVEWVPPEAPPRRVAGTGIVRKSQLDHLGNLVTPRSSGPFYAKQKKSAFSVRSNDVKANSGFESEVVVASQLVRDFAQKFEREGVHFDSQQLYIEHKLREVLSATQSTHNIHNPSTFRALCMSYILQHMLGIYSAAPSLKKKQFHVSHRSEKGTAGQEKLLLVQLLDYLDKGVYQRGGSSTNSEYTVPYFLRTKYLYEANQMVVEQYSRINTRLDKAQASIDKTVDKMNFKIVRVMFLAWKEWTGLGRQRQKLITMLSLARGSSSRSQAVFFQMWRAYVQRRKLQKRHRETLLSIQTRIKESITQLESKKEINVDAKNKLENLLEEFHFVNQPSNIDQPPTDIFYRPFAFLTFERLRCEIELLESCEGEALFRLAADFRSITHNDQDIAVQVDATLRELEGIGRSGQDDYEDVQDIISHLQKRLAHLCVMEEEEEVNGFHQMVSLSAEEFLLRWVGKHLLKANNRTEITDLSLDLCDSTIYLDLMSSVCPDVDMHTRLLETEKVDQRAALVLKALTSIGCIQIMNVDDFLDFKMSDSALDMPEKDSKQSDAAADELDSKMTKRSLTMHGDPDGHLAVIGSLFLQRPAVPPQIRALSPKAVVLQLHDRLTLLEELWQEIQADHVPDPDRLAAYFALLDSFAKEVDIMVKRLRRREHYTMILRKNVEDLIWSIQIKRQKNQRDMVSKQFSHAKEVQLYHELQLAKIMDLLNLSGRPLQLHRTIQTILGRSFVELNGIFRHYATATFTSDGGASMNLTSFLRFTRDCGLYDPKAMTKGVLNLVFTRCLMSVAEVSKDGRARHAHTHNTTDALEKMTENSKTRQRKKGLIKSDITALRLPHFMESLCRIAVVKYPNWVLSDALNALLAEHVFPHAGRLTLDEFHALVGRSKTGGVFQEHRVWLQSVFKHYASADLTDGRALKSKSHVTSKKHAHHSTTINQIEFTELIKDAHLLGATALKEKQLNSIFTKVLHMEDASQDTNLELSFSDFEESLAACALFLQPDPYVPVHFKIEHFLTKMLYPPLQKLLKRGQLKG